MKKKLFTLLFAIVASVGTLFAESGTCGDNLTWDLTDGVLTISGTGAMWQRSYSSYPWYSKRTSIQSLIITDGVTTIEKNAFYKCSGLTSVTIGNSVTNIGDRAFDNCSSLTSVTIPNSVTSIGEGAFRYCSGLTSVTIGNSVANIGALAFDYCSSLRSIVWKAKNCDDFSSSSPFYDSGHLISSFVFGGEVEHIPSFICADLNKIASIIIPNSVTSIGERAFAQCSSLNSVTIPNSVTSIGEGAFYWCRGLTSVTIPNSVTSIGNSAFSACFSLPVINNIRYADTYLVEAVDEELSSYIIKEGTKWIGSHAFDQCLYLTSIEIPNSIISIGEGAFWGCNSLTSMTIPNSVTEIGDYAFRSCTGLTSIEIPNSVTSIGEHAFDRCINLTSVIIPNSVTNIGDASFYGCSSLISIDVDSYNSNYISVEGILFNREKTVLIQYPIGKQDSLYVIPYSVTSLGSCAFEYCRLNTIISPSSIPPTISSSTFYGIIDEAHVFVPDINIYQEAQYWNTLNLCAICGAEKSVKSTSVVINFLQKLWDLNNNYITSCGIEGGEQQPGNVLEYIGLEPDSEYGDVPIILTSSTGETETVNVSFSTTALELTTKASKPVSSTTAILLAETNMSDAEVSCGFEWKRENAPDAMEGTKVYCPVASGQMAGRLKGLKDDVYYKYRAFYQSAAGNMYYGDWQYIFTGDATVEFDPILYTYGASVVTENEATVSGYALAGSEDFDDQGLEYWAESRVNGQRDQVPSTNGAPRRMFAGLNEHFFVPASGIKMTVTLTGLDEGTVYKYRVYGKVGDQYYYGAEQTFTTKGVYEEESPTAIEEVPSDPQSGIKAQKILRDGQIFILRGEKVYTITGQEVIVP